MPLQRGTAASVAIHKDRRSHRAVIGVSRRIAQHGRSHATRDLLASDLTKVGLLSVLVIGSFFLANRPVSNTIELQ